MERIDFKKHYKELYSGKIGKPVIVEVPELNYLMIDGRGDPNTSQEYTDAIQTLYPVAFTLKFACKKKLMRDYGVMPLEGLWWSDNLEDFSTGNKANWQWSAMIMQPEFITKDMVDDAIDEVREKKAPASIDKLRLQTYTEGRSAQVLYIGPYSEETETIKSLHEFISANGGELNENSKHHHEIYLSDPRRTAPEKLKTIIRQPF